MKLFFLGIMAILGFTLSAAVFAETPAKAGDIVIFNHPHEHYPPLQIKLLVCKNKKNTCLPDQLITITTTNNIIKPGLSAILNMSKVGEALQNRMLYVQLLADGNKKWSEPFILIDKYDTAESPYYQFICWQPTDSPPLCSTGHDEKVMGD